MGKSILDLKYLRYEHSFKKNLKKFEYPMTYLLEVAFFILIGIAELLIYVPYFDEHIIKVISDIKKMAKLEYFLGVIVSIVIIYIYILSKFKLFIDVNEYVKNANMIRTYINDEKNGLKLVESLFIDDKGKVIVERKDKNIDKKNSGNKERFLIEKNYYNQYDNIEYYTSSKQTAVSPSFILILYPFINIILSGILFYFTIIKSKAYYLFNIKIYLAYYMNFIFGMILLIVLNFLISLYWARKSKEIKQKNENLIINEVENFIKHTNKDKLEKKKILTKNINDNIENLVSSNSEELKNTIKKTIESEISKL
ncbi:hypothetical protein [Staphylococcus hominis]|uniref:hypothetical protein n=1 Tax=Staphylococcus hominis TaxID=1290 RepID=UPI0011A1C210|nr:hypothetical protein [Staphylococcus hominis]